MCAISLFPQTNSMMQKGTFFKTTPEEYFQKVIMPWRYQFIPAQTQPAGDSVSKVGHIIFWRSIGIYDNISKKTWKPDISFDIYQDSDSAFCKNLSDRIKKSSGCDSLRAGENIFTVGHFILLNSTSCVNCVSSSNINYCQNIIRRILEAVPDKETYEWSAILKQFSIYKGKFKS